MNVMYPGGLYLGKKGETMDDLKMKDKISGINDMGKLFNEVDEDARRVLKANIDGLLTGFRMGIEYKGDKNHGV